MAERAPTAQVPETEDGPQGLALMPPPAGLEWTSLSGQTTELSMWTLLAAVQAVESKVDSLTRRVVSLEGGRTSRAEKKKKKKVVLEGDKMELEFGNQMESKWAVLGTLIEEYGQLHRRVENMENLLKNQNFWILRFPPGVRGEVPKVPAPFEGSAAFLQEDWGNLEEGQKELYKQVVKGNYQYLLSLADAMAKPDVLSRMERGEGPCLLRQGGQLGVERKEGPTDTSMGSAALAFGLTSQIKQEPWDEEEEEEEGEERGTEVDGSTAETWLANPKARRHSGGLETHWTKESLDPQEAHGGGGGSSPRPEQTLSSQEKVTPGGLEWDRTVPRTPLQGSAEGPCPCDDDSRRFSRKEPLVRHHHMGERPYACPTCGKAFIHQSSLTTHHRTHTGEKPYACPTCLKRFTRLSTLLEHQRTHTGEKPYACTECEKRFTRLSTLVEHRRTHTGEKPYQCAQCHKSFTRLTNLTVHQNTHAGERAYSCAQCGRRFPQRACFVKHLRTHTQESPHQCPDCDQGFLDHSWQDSFGQQPRSCGWKERPLQSQPGPPGEWPLTGIQVSSMKTEDVG